MTENPVQDQPEPRTAVAPAAGAITSAATASAPAPATISASPAPANAPAAAPATTPSANATTSLTPGVQAVRTREENAPPAAFQVENLSMWYGKKQALFDITTSIPSKTITAIIGPSGCGKSTFLRCLNRMHELVPQARLEGTVRLFGQNLYERNTDPAIVRRRVGMVFQKSNPFPTMSIGENVVVGLRLNGVRNRALLNERMEKALRMAALWDEVKNDLNRPGMSLSGGQQQRLCIARAVAVEPEVLLMDEPASALDPIATMKIEELTQQLKANYTIVIVTHNMQQASRVSDRTMFFYMGKLIEYGETKQIFFRPLEKRTEDYITGRFG